MGYMVRIDHPEAFVAWATSAKPGQRADYYRGYLYADRMQDGTTRKGGTSVPTPLRLANKAWEFYELGIVRLVQKRMGNEDYIYIAEKK